MCFLKNITDEWLYKILWWNNGNSYLSAIYSLANGLGTVQVDDKAGIDCKLIYKFK